MDRSLTTCFAIAAALAPAMDALAHGGGLDRHGCHHDRKRGGYHCHRAPGPSAPRNSAGAGYAARNNLTDYVTPTYSSPASSSPTRNANAFRNCSAARAAGAAPVRRGEPSYGAHLDRDGDGVGCE